MSATFIDNGDAIKNGINRCNWINSSSKEMITTNSYNFLSFIKRAHKDTLKKHLNKNNEKCFYCWNHFAVGLYSQPDIAVQELYFKSDPCEYSNKSFSNFVAALSNFDLIRPLEFVTEIRRMILRCTGWKK